MVLEHRVLRTCRIAVAACGALLSLAAAAERFDFVVLGDTAYNLPDDYTVYARLIERINAAAPAFSIHVGDTWGALPCTEEAHRNVRDWFARYQQPVVYTPGDNEWTDCRKPEVLATFGRVMAGQATPAEAAELGRLRGLDSAFAGESYGDVLGSLATIRRVFFGAAESLGANPMPVVRQADVSEFDDLVENLRWERAGVLFATAHVTGSGNGFTLNDAARADEAIARNRANVEWLKATFAEAQVRDAKAVVVALHAALFEDAEGDAFSGKALRGGDEGPYFWVAMALRDLAARFGRPVLLVNGDYHELVIDRPFLVSQGEGKPPLYGNVTRLQVYGAPELRAVRVSVDTEMPWVFGFTPLYD
jgi:hypothetical protein